MTHDKDGNLVPLMLSQLIATAQAALDTHGDMICWLEASDLGYDDTIEISVPLSTAPEVVNRNVAKSRSYWLDQDFPKTFVISGSPTG